MRLKLRTLFVILFCIALVTSILTNRARKVALARAAMSDSGAEFDYEYQIAGQGMMGPMLNRDAKSPISSAVPASLQWLFPQPIYRVAFNPHHFMRLSTSAPVDSKAIEKLSDAGPIRGVIINDGTNLTDAAFSKFENIQNLEYVSISVKGGSFSNAGFEMLCKAPNLKSLDISGGSLDRSALQYLSGTQISSILLYDTGITDEELKEFAKQNPHVSVMIQGRFFK